MVYSVFHVNDTLTESMGFTIQYAFAAAGPVWKFFGLRQQQIFAELASKLDGKRLRELLPERIEAMGALIREHLASCSNSICSHLCTSFGYVCVK